MFCGHCGAENEEKMRFCNSCGRLLAEAQEQSPADGSATAPPPPPPGQYIAPPPGSTSAAPPPGPYIAASGDTAQPQPPGNVPPRPGAYDQVQNTSGMGGGYPMPPETQNMNWAGCLPCGIFAFMNGALVWGVVTLVASFFVGGFASLLLVIKGNEFAWQGRRFASRQEYNDTMNAWNYWGKLYTIVSVILTFIGFVAYFWLVFWMIGQGAPGGFDPGTYDPATGNFK